MAEVRVEDVRKAFGSGTPVLDGVSFTAADGEFVSLLGPSGCGKTTLLRIIAGLESATSGRVLIGGRDATRLPPKDRDIAMVFQNYALYPHLDVESNIGMGLKLRGVPPAEVRRRVEEAARMLGLDGLLGRRPAGLSGGQRQRVALARALVREPKAYLLDEPLSNLDAVLRERTRGELKLLFRRLRGTAIYVTHDQVEAMTLSDRIVVLHQGRIQQVGTPEDIYLRPANTFVAGFLGSPPMNLFPAPEGGGVLWGIRPEEVEVLREERPGSREFAVALAEPVGPHAVLTLESEGLSLRALWPGSWDPSRGRVHARLPPERLHRFDAATGARLPVPV